MKDKKDYSFTNLFGGKSSKLLIGLLGISAFALVLYLGVSLTSKGTFSAGAYSGPGVYCHIGDNNIKEKVYIKEADLTTGICYGRFYDENELINYDSNDPDYNSLQFNYAFDCNTLSSADDPECGLENIDQFACLSDGRITYIASCRSDNMCGTAGYYFYNRNGLDFSLGCMVGTISQNGAEKHIVGVQKFDTESNSCVSIVSCGNGKCYSGYTDNASALPAPSGYAIENLTDATDEMCANNTGYKKCYKCTQTSTHTVTSVTPDIETVTATESCPEGYTDQEITSCVKNCVYCTDGSVQTFSGIYYDLPCSSVLGGVTHEEEERDSLNCSSSGSSGSSGSGSSGSGSSGSGSSGSGSSGSSGSGTTMKTCHKCTNDGMDTQQFAYCDSNTGWFENVPNCCWECNGTNKVRVSIPSIYTCDTFDGYEASKDDLNCSGSSSSGSSSGSTGSKTCYYCSGENKLSFKLEASANGDCSKSSLHSGAVADAGLNCFGGAKRCYNDPTKSVGEWVRVVSCDGNGNAGNCTLTDGRVVSRSTITESYGCNVDDNSQTGSTAIIIAWIIGFTAIGYAFYYFRQTNVKGN